MDNITQHMNICAELNKLYEKKNHDYGDSFHKSYEEFGLTMAAIRLDDKLNRFKTLIKVESKVKDESIRDTLVDLANSIRDTLVDLANYSIMAAMELDRKA